MNEKYMTTVAEACTNNLARTEYLVWTDPSTRYAGVVLDISPTTVEGNFRVLFNNGNLEILLGQEELMIMPAIKNK